MTSYAAVLTVPSGKVASDLTAFVVRVSLADMPADWWAACNGENIRVKASGTDVPIDVVTVDLAAHTGELFFKASLAAASNNVFTVECVNGATAPADTDTNGRNAVWSDYDLVINFAEWVDRTGNGHDPVLAGSTTGYSSSTEISPGSSKFSQGAAWDGTYWYATGDNRVEKFNAAGVSQASVGDLSAATAAFNGLTFTHGSGCCIMGGELYISVEDGDSAGTNQHIVVLNTTTLAVARIYDVSGHGEMSDICWNSDDSLFYLSDFFNDNRIHVFDSTFSSYSTLTLPGSGVADAQGIEWAGGSILLMSGPISGTSALYTVADDMTGSLSKVWTGPAHLQGLAVKSKATTTPDVYVADFNLLLKLTFTTGTSSPGWLSLGGNGNAEVQSLHKRTQWTYAATTKFPAVPTSGPRTILSYSNFSTTDGNRETLAIQGSNSKWDLWDNSNAHLAGTTAVSGDIGQRRRAGAIFDGTTVRKLYLQGALVGTDNTVTQRPAGGTDGTMALFIGAEDTSHSERWIGDINYVYLRNGVLSADWLAAEYASWEGSTFYIVAPAIVVDGWVPALTGSVDVALTLDVTVNGVVPPLTGNVAITTPGLEMTVDGQVPALTGDVAIAGTVLTVDGVVPPLTGAVSLTTLSRAASVASDAPLVWLRLGASSGSVADDSSGNSNDGTVSGSLTWGHDSLVATDPSNKAATFGSDYITVPLTGGDEITFEGLFAEVSSSFQYVAERPGYFRLYISSTGIPSFGVLNVENQRTGRTASVEFGISAEHPAPHAFAVVVTETDTYLRVASDDVSYSDTYSNVPADPDSHLVVGASAAHGNSLAGALDEIAYYDTALGLDRISEHILLGDFLELTVTVDGVVPPLTGDVAIEPFRGLTVDGQVPALTGDVNFDLAPMVTVDGQVPALTGDVTVELVPIAFVTVDGVVPPLTGAVDLRPPNFVTVDGVVPPLTGDVALHGADAMIVDGQVPALTGDVTLGVPPQTDTGNRASGRTRSGLGVVFYDPPVVDPPDFSIAQHTFVSTRSYVSATMVGTRPVFSSITRQQTRRARDRVVVGGVDITWFRGVNTPAPSYGLVVPLLYGAGRLPLPQVAAAFEHPGQGDLAWAKQGATVLVQRVDPDTNAVVATDYIGFVVAHDISGRNLVLELGGEATGRAAMIDKQPPLFLKRNDLGFWWWGAIADLGLRFEPRLGPSTGIKLRNAGGMDQLSYIQDLSAKGTRRNGTQLTCMPDAREDGGAYRVAAKDLDTIHATVYLDDTVTVPDVRDDMAEKPNRVYATGVSPEGMRINFGAYPLLRDANPAPYPFNDNRHFGVGTTDADTDTGDGIAVMIWRLTAAGYLDLADKPGGFDDDVADAIEDLKADVYSGPSFIDGDMTPQAWAGLFNVSATGYSLADTQILPAAQRSATKPWNRTSTGAVISRNEDYDPTLIKVDATVSTGVDMRRKQIRGFARGELAPAGDQYVGTITLNSGGLIRGEHTPGDPLTEGDVMDAREVRPGMNVWAPLFSGGTLFHVSGVERTASADGDVVVLDVDTQARDSMKVWEVIARNRESRRNPARVWLNQHRSSALTKDAVTEFDEIGGTIDDRVDLAGGAWTVFPVVAGQEGTIRSLRLETQAPTEFVVAVFGKQVTESALKALVGNPLTKGGKKKWLNGAVRKKLDRDFVLLYTAGEKKAPCGYFPGKKFPDPIGVDTSDDDVTDPPDAAFLTGEWQDDAGFSYHCFDGPVLWVAIWAADAAHLAPGRVMWPQLEAGS